jgi:asparagine synthase (glutamine-hydrolysing)
MPGLLGIVSEKSESKLFKRMIDVVNHYNYSIDLYEKDGLHLSRVHLNYVNILPQPVFSDDKRYVLFMIGEIFSYGNIEVTAIQSDSAFLLNILINEGLSVLPEINGHYSAVLYDFFEKRLVLISDRYGTRPIYYSLNQGRLLFAPEVKAILEDQISKDIDYHAISHLFHFSHLFGHRTMFSNIHQLPESSYLVFQDGGIQIYNYWEYTYHEDVYNKKKLNNKDQEEYIDELDYRISLAMKRVMTKNSDDILLSLSGGLDSRYVAAYAHQFGLGNLSAFTFGPANCDDQIYSRQVAEMLNISHKAFDVLPENIWKDAEIFAYISDYMSIINGPVQGFTPLQHYFHKKSVTISSQMADAIFGGNLWRRKIQYLISMESFNNKAEDIVINIFNLINEDLLKELFEDDFYYKIKDGYKEVPLKYISKYKHPLYTYINLLMNEHGRRGTLCGNLMNNLFLETRMPSYDNDLMDFAYKLPLHLRFNQYGYRKVFSKRFPDLARIRRERYNLRVDSPEVFYKLRIVENKIINTIKKTSLKHALTLIDRWNKPTYIDHNHWFKRELNKVMTDLLTDHKTRSRSIYKKKGLEKIIVSHQNDLTDNSKLIWQIINLEYFFRKFID